MGIERRISRDSDLKVQKLEKTKARRQKLDAQRRLAEQASGNRRNDLLPSLAIRQVPISSLRDAPRKVRRRDPDQVERLAGAIARFGFTVPILVSGDVVLDGHATPKPVELCVDALLDVTSQGDVVLDAFLGSGTTLAAAEQCGRRCYGIELDPRFVDVTLQRWTALTGKSPILAETEETFADVARRRCDDDEEDDLESGPDMEDEQ